MTKRQHPEHSLQRSVVKMLRSGILHPDVFWTAINPLPGRTPAQGAQSKQLGVQAGVPDLLFVHKGFSLWIELKAGKERLSEAQNDCVALLMRAHGRKGDGSGGEYMFSGIVAVCRSEFEVESLLAAQGMTRTKAKAA